MADMMEQAEETQSTLGRSYAQDDVDDADEGSTGGGPQGAASPKRRSGEGSLRMALHRGSRR